MTEKRLAYISIGVGLFGIIMFALQLSLPEVIARNVVIVILSVLASAFVLVILVYGTRLLLRKLINMIRDEIHQQYDLINSLGILGSILYENTSINMVVRTKTMQIIFDHIVNSHTSGDPKLVLENLGRETARDLISDNWKERRKFVFGSDQSPEDAIRKWSKFETMAKWGEFEVPPVVHMEEGKFRGDIKVHSCFLASARNKSNNHLCSFLIGYIEVIISDLAGFPVEVKENNCARDSGDGTCDFTFKPR